MADYQPYTGEYIQAGYVWEVGCPYTGNGCYFAEYDSPLNGFHQLTYAPISSVFPYPQNRNFRVYRGNGGAIYAVVYGTWATGWYPLQWVQWDHSIWMAETFTTDDRIVGGTSAPVAFQSLQHCYQNDCSSASDWWNDNPQTNPYLVTAPYGVFWANTSSSFLLKDSRS